MLCVCDGKLGWKQDNVQLSNWVSTQRQEYKLLREGRSSRLNSEKIKKLEEIGFVWEAQRGGPRRKKHSGPDSPPRPPIQPRSKGGYTVPVHRLQDRRSQGTSSRRRKETGSLLPKKTPAEVALLASAANHRREVAAAKRVSPNPTTHRPHSEVVDLSSAPVAREDDSRKLQHVPEHGVAHNIPGVTLPPSAAVLGDPAILAERASPATSVIYAAPGYLPPAAHGPAAAAILHPQTAVLINPNATAELMRAEAARAAVMYRHHHHHNALLANLHAADPMHLAAAAAPHPHHLAHLHAHPELAAGAVPSSALGLAPGAIPSAAVLSDTRSRHDMSGLVARSSSAEADARSLGRVGPPDGEGHLGRDAHTDLPRSPGLHGPRDDSLGVEGSRLPRYSAPASLDPAIRHPVVSGKVLHEKAIVIDDDASAAVSGLGKSPVIGKPVRGEPVGATANLVASAGAGGVRYLVTGDANSRGVLTAPLGAYASRDAASSLSYPTAGSVVLSDGVSGVAGGVHSASAASRLSLSTNRDTSSVYQHPAGLVGGVGGSGVGGGLGSLRARAPPVAPAGADAGIFDDADEEVDDGVASLTQKYMKTR